MIREEDGGLKVVFPFSGQQHEVHSLRTSEQAYTILACLATRAAAELQRCLDTAHPAGLPGAPSFHPFTPSASTEVLTGGFNSLVQELQDCVLHDRMVDEEGEQPAAYGLLLAAASRGLALAAQQLLVADPRQASAAPVSSHNEQPNAAAVPVHVAALSPTGGDVLKCLLAAAPQAVHISCWYPADDFLDWSLMHSVASGGNSEAVRAVLQLAPHLAGALTSYNHTPLHEAVYRCHSEAAQLLLEAAPATKGVCADDGGFPLHWAVGCPASLRLLLASDAPGLDVADARGNLPLHHAAVLTAEECVHILLNAAPSTALATNVLGKQPLHTALDSMAATPSCVRAARVLLPASGLGAAQLLDLLAASPAGAAVQPLYASLATHFALSVEQWQRVPSPCAGLASALGAVLERSQAEAALLVARLPHCDLQFLRTALLCMRRWQRSVQAHLPTALLCRVLAAAFADA